MSRKKPGLGFRTRAIHSGEAPDPATHASAPNIVMSTTFVVDDTDVKFSANALDGEAPYIYTRWANPTVRQLETKLSDLEGGEAAVAFASGAHDGVKRSPRLVAHRPVAVRMRRNQMPSDADGL